MNSRRNFIKTVGSGIAASTIAPSIFANTLVNDKKLVIGIIGAENSHSYIYGKVFNIEKKFPGVELKYIWGETDAFAKRSMEKGEIPIQVKDPAEMMGKIDALIVDHRHAKYHLPAATPFVKAGIPTFVDKPFCYRAAEGKEFLEMAHKTGTPVTSYSSIAHSAGTLDMKAQLAEMGHINQVVRTGTVDLDSKYGGIFFYGVHLVQPLLEMFGEDVDEVKITRDGRYGNASLKFSNGLFATLIFKRKAYGWQTYIETDKQFVELKSRVEEPEIPMNDASMIEMFRTGKLPRTYQSILNNVSVLEAMEKSAVNENWVEVEYQKLNFE